MAFDGKFIDSLVLLDQGRRERKKQIYKKILEQCKDRILQYTGCNKYCCIFDIPIWKVGEPLYEWDKATSYVMKKLRKEGFVVTHVGYNKIFVNWKSIKRTPLPSNDSSNGIAASGSRDAEFQVPNLEFLTSITKRIDKKNNRARTQR